MKKLKEFYKNNRVYSILMIVSILCIISILVGVIVYFLNQTKKDPYGTRLYDIVSISDKDLTDIESKISENDIVNKVNINLKGKLIYVNITLNSGTHADSESICQESIALFSDEIKKDYDIQYIVSNKDKESKENFPVMGYLKAEGTSISWTNYVQSED